MTTAQAVIQKILVLSAEKQKRVLDYVERIAKEPAVPAGKPLFNPEGIAAGAPSDLSLEDFQRNRREMWGTASDRELQ